MRPIAPRTIEPRLLAGAGLDFQAPKPEGGTLDTALSGPGYGAQVDLGASFTVHDRWGLDLMGTRAWQGNMYWVKDTSCWEIAVPSWRAEAKLWKLLPTTILESGFVKVGLGGGFSWQEAGAKERSEGIFGVRTQFEAMARTYWCAELGWWHGEAQDKWELVFRYARHLQRSPAYTAEVYAGPDSKRFTVTQDHIAFVFRYHLGFPRRPERGTVAPETALVERNTDTLTTLATHRASVPLVLWDDAEHDGDTISVVLNGRVVLDHHGLSNAHTRGPVVGTRGQHAADRGPQRGPRAAQHGQGLPAHGQGACAFVGEDHHGAQCGGAVAQGGLTLRSCLKITHMRQPTVVRCVLHSRPGHAHGEGR